MTWPPGSHGSTFGGNPVSCAASLVTLDLLEEELMDNAVLVGRYLKDRLVDIQSRHPIIGDVRGMGLMLAIEFVLDRTKKTRAPQIAEDFVQNCFRKGLLVLGCGECSVRFAPPLIVTQEEIDIAIEIIESVLYDME